MEKINIFKQYRGLPREIYILCVSRIINSLGGFVFPFLTLFLNEKMGMPEDQMGFFMMTVSLVTIPGAIIAGKLADKYNRKAIILIFNFIPAVIFIICGFLADTMLVPYLLMAAVFFGSFSWPANSAMTTDLTTPENRQSCYSLIYLGMNMGLAVGYMMAGYLFENHTQWLFWGDGITTIAGLLLVLLFVKDTKPTEKEIEEINASDRDGEKMESGSVFSALLNRPFLLAFTVIGTIIGFVYSQHGFIMPLHLKAIYGSAQGARYFGQVMTFNTIIVVFLTSAIINLTKKYKPITNVAISTFTYIIGFGMLYFAKTIEVFVVAVIIWTVGEIIASVNSGVYVSNHSPVTHRGRFNSLLGIIGGTGRSFAPLLMGMFLVDHSYAQGWLVTGFAATVAFAMLLMLRGAEKKSHAKKSSGQEIEAEVV